MNGGFKGVLISTLVTTSIVALAMQLLSTSPVHATLTSHAPIYINGNSGFTAPDPVNGGGSGTASDPYIIENWAIDARVDNGITISNTTVHFIIRNCLVENVTKSLGEYKGIVLNNVVNGKIESCKCNNNPYGIYLYYSNNNTLDNNTCVNDSYGIYLNSSSNNTLENNACSNNINYGIRLDLSSNNTLDNNSCFNSTGGYNVPCGGFELYYSYNNTLTGNTCSNNPRGIYLFGADNNITLTNNTCENNEVGIYLSGSDYDSLTGNTCVNNARGIYLYSECKYNNVTGNTCENNENGIYLQGSNNFNYIYHNSFVNNSTQAYDDGTNFWDNGYPSGGNYWSDYTGVDIYSGPNQDIPGSDEIGDNRYDISGGANQDRYPLLPSVCGVEVTIENKFLEGLPCETLAFTIDVHNSGNVVDNILLSYIHDGWPDITIVPLVLIDVMPSEHRQATMFVHVPDNALPCTYKDITVVAESQFCGATDNDTAQAHVIEQLENLTLQLLAGWNLVSFPVTSGNNTPDNLFPGLTYLTDYRLLYWQAPGGPFITLHSDQVLEDNRGYWVWINRDYIVTTSGTRPASRTENMKAGWNMVCFPVDNASTTPRNVFPGLTYLENYRLLYWAAPGGPYKTQPEMGLLNDNTGYWVWIDRNFTITVPA